MSPERPQPGEPTTHHQQGGQSSGEVVARFAKGHPRMGGRKKGTPNRTTASVREALLAAFDEVGGVAWLVALARREPVAFARCSPRWCPRRLPCKTRGRSSSWSMTNTDKATGSRCERGRSTADGSTACTTPVVGYPLRPGLHL